MSVKWTGNSNESGILRKSDFKEKKEELFVFGYSCKLFRDDDKALHVDQGKHLIPWMGDETLKIDRYDARGALHDLTAYEAPSGGYDWRVELTKAELDVEQLCDEERYRALHTDEDEEEMYKEEELKRFHAAGYGQVGFNYDAPQQTAETPQPVEVDELFEPTPSFKALLPPDMILPDTQKQNAIIEKTAMFIATQGAQMEILIKAKQQDNPQFKFLNRDSTLHPYYTALIGLVKAGKWPEKKVEIEEKPPENEEYLHPSLANTIIELAPSIPSIPYKPSADCDYTMLVSKMRGEATLDEPYTPVLAPGEVAPPGTEPLPLRTTAEISRAPVMYNRAEGSNHEDVAKAIQAQTYHQQYAAYYQQYMASQTVQPPPPPAKKDPPVVSPTKSTGLSLMKNYNSDSDSDVSDCDDASSTDSKEKPVIAIPPDDVRIVIDKMAAYVARNGDEFAEIVRAKNDPRLKFLEPDNEYHTFYKRLMHQKRGIDFNGVEKDDKNKNTPPVSFSIKKLKEPDPILPKPALPYESSTDEESEEKQAEKETENAVESKDAVKTSIVQVFPTTNLPPVIVYKLEAPDNNASIVRTFETGIKTVAKVVSTEESNQPSITKPVPSVEPNVVTKIVPFVTTQTSEIPKTEPIEDKVTPKADEKATIDSESKEDKKEKFDLPDKRVAKKKDKENHERRREKRKHRDRKKEYKSEGRERKSERDVEKEKKRDREIDKDKKRMKYSKDELETEIISLEDNSDDLIDLTGDQSDTKGEADTEVERAKQQERRRRAAEFLKRAGVDPAAAALPTSSLASAMVDTLESLGKKKQEEEEKRRRREKRRQRERREYQDESERSHRKSRRRKYRSSDENGDTDFDSSKKKKRKKDKKHSSTKNKKKRKRENEIEVDHPLPSNIDLTNTLKELRTSSPTKELVQEVKDIPKAVKRRDSSTDDEEGELERDRKSKKRDREYSEGEWSSDSEADSVSSRDG